MHDLLLWIKSRFNLKKIYFTFFSSIAFYPSIISLATLLLAFLLLYLDALGVSYSITEHIQLIITHNTETARSLLSTLASGILSLMVFSFSMVMVVLTMASNNYTPRVLPGLINKRNHQVVLGIYLGTIGYILVVLINVGSNNYDFDVPNLSVLMSIILVFICFSAFIYFIHSISQSIQIANILANLYNDTLKVLDRDSKHKFVEELPGVSGWQSISSPHGAYFQGIAEEDLMDIAQEEDLQVLVMPEVGEFVLQGAPILKVSKPLSLKVQGSLQHLASFYHQEHVRSNYLFGFKHITEVAAKALSPGINDPGTAINAIDYLTQLMSKIMDRKNYRVMEDDQGYNRIFFRQTLFEKTFYLCFSTIRNYASGDVAVQLKLLNLVNTLEEQDQRQKYKSLFEQERNALLMNADQQLHTSIDKDILNKGAKHLAAEGISRKG